MLVSTFCLLFLGSVRAVQSKLPGECSFEVSVEITTPSMTEDDPIEHAVGRLSTLSAETIAGLLLYFPNKQDIAPKDGVHRRLTVDAYCRLWPEWNAVKLTTSDKNAYMSFEFWKKASRIRLDCIYMKFDFPQDLDSFVLDFDVYPYSEPNLLTSKLPQTKSFTIFPEGKLNPSRLTPKKIGLDRFLDFPEDYVCLMEVQGNASRPITCLHYGTLLFMAAKSPIYPESEWSLVDLDYGSEYTPPEVDDSPIPVEVNSYPYDTTRLYAPLSSREIYIFAPRLENSLYHHVGFADRYRDWLRVDLLKRPDPLERLNTPGRIAAMQPVIEFNH